MTNEVEISLKMDDFVQHVDSLLDEIEKAIVGKRETLERILAAFLSSGGHILIEDYPGLAKTLIANSFASVFGLEFRRIQFTPDLLPGDITGGYIFDPKQNGFMLRKGPIFTNILLADEINRASPKTQSALLEAMQEYQVTLEGETQDLPYPFIVVATQNPIEYEGTFPLPEAQLDRFIVKLDIGYPDSDQEREILERRRQRKDDEIALNPVVSPTIFAAMRALVEEVHVAPDVERYIVDLVTKTRSHPKVAVGSSPRGSLALFKVTRAWAAIQGRTFVTPDDVKHFARVALAHRLILQPNLWGSRATEEDIVAEVLETVTVPVILGEYE
jgi:MoxR-like ATPase